MPSQVKEIQCPTRRSKPAQMAAPGAVPETVETFLELLSRGSGCMETETRRTSTKRATARRFVCAE